MHSRRTTSVIADILCVLLTAAGIAGCFYIDKADATLRDIASPEMQTEVVAVYVMQDDPADTIEDAADYTFGVTDLSGIDTYGGISARSRSDVNTDNG